MHQRKSKKILIYLFILILFSSISNISINNFKFGEIQKINISGLEKKNNKILLNKVNDLNLGNIFFLNKNEIEELINSNSLIERFVIFKKYPSTININVEKTIFLAKINENGKNFLVGSNGKLTFNDSGYNELPYIFGKAKIRDFFKLKKIIDKSKFSYNQIQNMYFYPSKRWDLKLKDNILLKLPNNLTQEILDHLYEFLEYYTGEDLTIVDARLKNKIILNEYRK